MVFALLFLFLVSAASTFLGAMFGRTKERCGLGAVLGFFFGPLGWILILLMPAPEQPPPGTFLPCPSCSRIVMRGRTSCNFCKTTFPPIGVKVEG